MAVISLSDPKLDLGDFSQSVPTEFSLPQRKPGRPKKIPDEMLRRNRNELLFVFEENWALVGWDLPRAKTGSALRAVLGRIKGINCRILEILCLENRQEKTFQHLEAARKRLLNQSENLREAYRIWERCDISALRAQSAIVQAGDTPKTAEIRAVCEEKNLALVQSRVILNRLQSETTDLQETIQRMEASFAQSEVLDFIRCGRYELKPLNFAKALAGLPIIHWRQSIARCEDFGDNVPRGLTYSQFLIVAETINFSPANFKEIIEQMKTRLLRAKPEEIASLNELAKNWYFLWCAIETVFRGDYSPTKALPYRIFAEYQRRIASRAPFDILRAEKENMSTPAYVKWRAQQVGAGR